MIFTEAARARDMTVLLISNGAKLRPEVIRDLARAGVSNFIISIDAADVEPGFEPEQVITFNAAPPFGRYPQAIDRANFKLDLQRRLESIPGV